MQIITIVENNHVTGVVYGTVEINDEKIIKQKHLERYAKIKIQNTQKQYKLNTRQK